MWRRIIQATAFALAVPLAGAAEGRFEIAADGHQVLDRQTGLVWKRCAEGQNWDGSVCTGFPTKFSFGAATLVTSNPSGWRIPTVKELLGLAQSGDPGSGPSPFANDTGTYWSSTPQVGNAAAAAMIVEFAHASTVAGLRRTAFAVRMARSPSPPPDEKGMRFAAVTDAHGRAYAVTECVRDTVTGLTWEGKPSDGSFRDASHRYTHFDDQNQLQLVVSNVPAAPSAEQIAAAGNAAAYVKAVNAVRLCGFSDWRLPSLLELHDLVDFARPAPPLLEPTWLPNTPARMFYWAAEGSAARASSARILDLSMGMARGTSRATPGYVRLVR
jgi:hypothetical protein